MVKKLASTKKYKKAYWSLLKAFSNNKKAPLIPRVFHSQEFITDFKKKAEMLNSFFVNQNS